MSGQEDDKNLCLICVSHDGRPLHALSDGFPCNKEDAAGAGGAASQNLILSQQLPVIFLLRRVLRLDRGFLETVLRQTGNNPSAWDLKLCRMCYRTLEEADFIYLRLRKLHADFEELSQILWKKLLRNARDVGENDGEAADLQGMTKRPGRPKRRRGRQSTKELLSQKVMSGEDSLTVTQKIWKEIVSRRKLGTAGKEFCVPFRKLSMTETETPDQNEDTNVNVNFNPKDNPQMFNEDNLYVNDRDEFSEGENNLDGFNSNSNDVNSNHDVSEPRDNECNSDYDFDPHDHGSLEANHHHDDDDDDDDLNDDPKDIDFEIVRCSTRTRKKSRLTKYSKKTRFYLEKEKNSKYALKAIKLENTFTYSCPKCKDIFDDVSACDAHILEKHFEEGSGGELTYEVIPLGQTMSCPEEETNVFEKVDEAEDAALFNRTFDDPPVNAFSIPVTQGAGLTRYLVLPHSIKRLPQVYPLLQVSPDGRKCGQCNKKFPIEMQLRAHVKRLHDEEPMCYDCPICPKRFERIGKTLLHVQRAHMQGKHVCDDCGNSYKEEILLKAHIQRDHLGIQYPYHCLKCNVRYPRRNALNKHLKVVHKLQIASYHLLTRPTPQPRTTILKRKKRKRLEKKFPCEICLENGRREMKFVSEMELDVHIKRRHMGISRPYPCPVCGKKYSKPEKVEQHLKTTHTISTEWHVDDAPTVQDTPLPFVCHPCNKQFKNRSMYNFHLKGLKHQGIRSFVCELCSKGFTGLKYLQNHQHQMHHKELKIDPFKCKFCGKILSSERTLNDHIKLRHTMDAKFSCPHCDVQFQHKSNMEQHINALHSKAHKFLCPQCPKTFLRDFYLKNHFQRVHSGLQPYECQYCSKKFSDKSTYNRHVEAHSDVVHTCPHCGKSGFKTRHALRVHLKTLHKNELEEFERRQRLARMVKPQEADISNEVSISDGESLHPLRESSSLSNAERTDQDNLQNNDFSSFTMDQTVNLFS